MESGPLVILSGGLRIQILATAADISGHLVTEGKISLAVIPRIRGRFPDFNWSAGGRRAWMASEGLSNS